MSLHHKIAVNNLKLGVFVIAGLLFLVLLLYMIGKNRSLFGSHFILKAQFENTQGLVPGNNVRFMGIEVGSVKSIRVLADTLVQIEMVVQDKMSRFIHQNALVSIGSEGFVGNKVVNIQSAKAPAPLVKEGDILKGKKAFQPDDMLMILNKTNINLSRISEELIVTISRINNSNAFWQILNDEDIPQDLNASIKQMYGASAKINNAAADVAWITNRIRNGEGSLGAIIEDTAFIYHLHQAVNKISNVGNKADSLAVQINEMAKSLEADLQSGNGVAHAILNDTAMVAKINNSLQNIEQGTAAFDENMQALKSNFLLRGYYRKQAKNNKKL